MQSEMAALVRPGSAAADFQPRVIVMTDGKNEVMRGDDSDLLDGPLGMQQAVANASGLTREFMLPLMSTSINTTFGRWLESLPKPEEK
jgi:hypothetical protein